MYLEWKVENEFTLTYFNNQEYLSIWSYRGQLWPFRLAGGGGLRGKIQQDGSSSIVGTSLSLQVEVTLAIFGQKKDEGKFLKSPWYNKSCRDIVKKKFFPSHLKEIKRVFPHLS
jgi:hypothetical protein